MAKEQTNRNTGPAAVYNALKCKRCKRPILFDDEANKHSDPFQATCQTCRHTALYRKRVLLSVIVSNNS